MFLKQPMDVMHETINLCAAPTVDPMKMFCGLFSSRYLLPLFH